MKKFEQIIKYIPTLEAGSFGKWIVDKRTKGTKKNPIQLPYVIYSQSVQDFKGDTMNFAEEHEEYECYNYSENLLQKGIKGENTHNLDVSNYDDKTIISLLVFSIRADRFCEGALLSYLEDGSILKWVKRLEEIDNQNNT